DRPNAVRRCNQPGEVTDSAEGREDPRHAGSARPDLLAPLSRRNRRTGSGSSGIDRTQDEGICPRTVAPASRRQRSLLVQTTRVNKLPLYFTVSAPACAHIPS